MKPSDRSKMTRFGALAIATALSAGALTQSFATRAHADQQPSATNDPALVARVDEIASAMKNVGKAVEPSVVSIEVTKRAGVAGGTNRRGGIDDDLLKQFFPDTDGDGQPNVPENFRFRFGPNGGGSGGGGSGAPDLGDLRARGEGSGVILDAEGGKAFVLTNNHVAGDAETLVVTLSDGRQIEDVRVVGTDPRSDLAVLEIKADDLVATRWGTSSTLEKGDIVLAFGSPFGYVGSMTQGIVSGTGRTTNPNGGNGILGRDGYENFIQTDCAINPGNSGGPLVNVHGEIVGINTAIASGTGSFNGIGFAIPSDFARNIYEQLKTTGKVTRGFLGVEIVDVARLDKRQRTQLLPNNERGVWVRGMPNDAPAAGKLQPNDVIVAVDGQKVTTSQELRLKVASTKPGATLKLGVIRAGKPRDVEVAVGTLPDREPQVAAAPAAKAEEPAVGELGATLTDANAARLKSAGVPENTKGALVTAVKTGSPAELASLEVGDVVVKVDETPVSNAAEAGEAIKAAKLADGLSLVVVNREGTKSVFVQTGE